MTTGPTPPQPPQPGGGPPARLLPFPLAVQIALSLALIGGVGLVAIGASGALAAGAGAWAGKSFVAGDGPGVTYTADRCADFREYHPEATACNAAAVAHHFDEVVSYRLTAGVLGLLVLAGVAVVRRTRIARLGTGLLPNTFTATVGTTAFGIGAAGLLFPALMQLWFGPIDGAGSYLTGGVVAIVPLVAFGLSLRRLLIERLPGGSAAT